MCKALLDLDSIMKNCVCFAICYCLVQSLSCVRFFVTPWTAACQASLSITNYQSLLKLMSIELVMPSNHLILCCPLLLLPSILPSVRVFSDKSVLRIRWPKYWSFSFSISPPNEYSGPISFRFDCLISLQSKGLKSLLQHHSAKVSILRHSAFFVVKLSHPHKAICGLNLANNHRFLHCAFSHIYIL